ncbi:unnamed protein product [Sympodiomycopsis kandeliae]
MSNIKPTEELQAIVEAGISKANEIASVLKQFGATTKKLDEVVDHLNTAHTLIQNINENPSMVKSDSETSNLPRFSDTLKTAGERAIEDGDGHQANRLQITYQTLQEYKDSKASNKDVEEEAKEEEHVIH